MNRSQIIEKAALSRLVEEKLLELFAEGKLFGTVHTCIGQEFIGAVISEFVEQGDTVFSNHRCHGHFLSIVGDVDGLIGELMGRKNGVCGGIGGSQHLCSEGFFSNGIQGGIVPVASGMAMGHKLNGNARVCFVFIGDGTLGEGAVYEALNIVAKWQLPLVIIIEDNKISQSTIQDETLAGSIQARAAAFDIDYDKGDTWDWEKLHQKAGALTKRVREKCKPAILHVETYRLRAHSKGDDTRSEEEVEKYKKRDPINLLFADSQKETKTLREDLAKKVEKAVKAANDSGRTPLDFSWPTKKKLSWAPMKSESKTRFVDALNYCLENILRNNHEVLLIGEDIQDPYGGAFKVTKGLSQKFPGRVKNTPISEAALVGMSSGLALTGFRPIVEIMFGDFLTLAFDQILNHLAKFSQMYNGQVTVPVIIRTPMGGGRGYGPTHSQSIEKHFLGIPGLKVAALNSAVDPTLIFDQLVETNQGPCLVIENKLMYGAFLNSFELDGFDLLLSDGDLPDALIKPRSNQIHVTILSYGGTYTNIVAAVDELFYEHEIICQVIMLSQIFPIDIMDYADLITKGDYCVVVEESSSFAGLGSELACQLFEKNLIKAGNFSRVAAEDYCIPSAGALEQEVLPSKENIVEVIKAVLLS